MPGIFEILGGPVKGLVEGIGSVIDSLSTTEEEKLEAKAKLLTLSNEFMSTLAQTQRDVIVAEAQGKSFLQRAWRPITMLCFVAIIVNNFILVPYVVAFGGKVPMLEIPPGMWGLLTVGIGGYIGGRTLEKIRDAS